MKIILYFYSVKWCSIHCVNIVQLKNMYMKRFLLLNFVAVVSLLAFVSCGDDDADYVQPTVTIEGADEFGARTLEFSNKEGSQQIEISANGDWFVRIPENASWLTVTPSQGTASVEPIAITVNVKLNEGAESRSATMALVCDDIEQKALLTVVQDKMYVLSASASRSMINKDGGDVVIDVEANAGWSYVIDDAGKSWLVEKEKSDTKLTLTASVLDVEERSAVVTFTSDVDPTLQAVVKLSQKDLELYAERSKVYVSPQGGEVTLSVVTTNVPEWNVEAADSWITATKVDENTVKLSVSAYGTSRREGVVNLTTPVDSEMVFPVTVVQRATSSAPRADVLDVVFGADGSASDVAGGNTVKYVAGDACSINYNDLYLRYTPTFTRASAGSSNFTDSYYRVDYTDAMMAALDDGYTMEAVVMVNAAPNGSEIKAFSATTSGGMALMIANTSRGKGLEFIQHNGSSWCFASTDVIPEVGVYYHLVGVYDAAEGKIHCYVNGELKASVACTGIKHMTTSDSRVRAFTIGGNTQSNTQVNGAWCGEVSVARIYDAPLTADQVKALYEDVRL